MLFVVERQHPSAVKCTVYAEKSIRSSFMLKLVLIYLRGREAISVRNEAEFLFFSSWYSQIVMLVEIGYRQSYCSSCCFSIRIQGWFCRNMEGFMW